MTKPKPMNVSAYKPGKSQTAVAADLEGSLQAIRRAALKARLVAQQTGTDLIVVRAGRIVRVQP